MNILRETNLSCATNIDESSPAVQGIAADTDTCAPSITVDLDDTVEQLLGSTGTLLHPRLLVGDTEELGTLDDGNLLIIEVLHHQLLEEVWPGAKVRVKDGKVVAVGSGKGPSQVARLLETRAVITDHVVETVALGEFLDDILGAVVEDVDADLVGRPVELGDVLPRVVQNLELLGADGQVDVNRGCSYLVDGEALDALLVRGVVPVLAHHTNPVADEEVDVEKADKDTVPVEVGRAEREEPHTRAQGQERENAKEVERDAVRVDVRDLLGIRGVAGQDEGRLLKGAVGLADPVVAALERVAGLALLGLAVVGFLLVLGRYGAAGRSGLRVRVEGVRGLLIDASQIIVVIRVRWS